MDSLRLSVQLATDLGERESILWNSQNLDLYTISVLLMRYSHLQNTWKDYASEETKKVGYELIEDGIKRSELSENAKNTIREKLKLGKSRVKGIFIIRRW